MGSGIGNSDVQPTSSYLMAPNHGIRINWIPQVLVVRVMALDSVSSCVVICKRLAGRSQRAMIDEPLSEIKRNSLKSLREFRVVGDYCCVDNQLETLIGTV